MANNPISVPYGNIPEDPRSNRQYIIYSRYIEQRSAEYSVFPSEMLPELQNCLINNGIDKLYTHQAEMFEKAQQRKNIVITTSTASGKTLGFLLPVVQDILKNPLTRAIFIYPTKALASDQYRVMQPLVEFFGNNKVSIGIYDGDTPVNERSRIRNSANIILTNPDMLNSAFLPNHSKFGFNFIFANLKYVVVDELHSYRGAFGSHLSNVFRRLRRVCRYYSSSPQYLCSSATIANPKELAENIFNDEFIVISRDGSPSPEKRYYFLQPPYIKGTNFRVAGSSITAELIPELVNEKRSFIAFCKSRKTVEVILREARDKMKYDGLAGSYFSDKISGYRGGYTPKERKQIEQKMISGELQGLISTNALELGIDIGKVDTTVITGYPGTRASFWQQSGRAGRSGQGSDTYMVLENLPFDQYLTIDPEWLFDSGCENAVIDRDNLYIQLAHTRAAAAELPLTLDDISVFPSLGEIIPVLLKAGELRNENGKFVWNGSQFPAGDFSLRNMDKNRYKLINSENNEVITEMDETQAFREIYKDAIYMHDGQSYQVTDLDLKTKRATAKPTDDNYYTEPFENTDLRIIKTHKTKQFGRTVVKFGDLNVTSSVEGYKRLQFHNHQNLGYEALDPALSKNYDTEGFWIDIPANVDEVYKRLSPANESKSDFWKSYYEGLGYALQNACMMTTMTTKDDINASIMIDTESERASMSVCIYDVFTGGLGYAEKAFSVIDTILDNAIKMVSGCQCDGGCPACVGDYHLDKEVVLWGLLNFREQTAPPTDIRIPPAPVSTTMKKPFSLDTLMVNWTRFREFIIPRGEYLSEFIASIDRIQIEGSRLVFFVKNAFIKGWITDGNNKPAIVNMLRQYIYTPSNFDIDVRISDPDAGTDNIEEKIVRKYEALTNDDKNDKQ